MQKKLSLLEVAFGVWKEFLKHKTEFMKLSLDMLEIAKKLQIMMT
jgi:hypothetical protein